MVNTIK